ncbi:NtaA/DmoA family FMN-dependent monooxygenase [Nesterenkonia lutea]|uniref:FMN-dependent oxidoreductase (Nitrilotriacetate monooxygenase family) n=1 Tax=Nesterenkonia lutea TaxID=272919 RepID=A0ABR9JFF1_9MICC|nr:NtaA/DmoA family FMN-dependent monooxygenase [Nesterenkonia lutea]MBE1524660.1 FMN-dependent oxidoreductase (nitrilotriacetate monooxygenase family) [Nesterenkonia lutea]
MKHISLGVFEMLNPNNGLPTWTHPDAKANSWDQMEYWVRTAKLLDEAGFDFLFFADTYGFPTIEGTVPEEVIRHGIQFPGLDPMLLISALASQTSRLGFVVTSPTTVEHPYATARRFASLDHYTAGRIGWNVVTGSSQTTTDRLFGLDDQQTSHDERYARAEEFLQVCSALWETSWEDDAETRDPEMGTYADPEKVHDVAHDGVHYRCHGPFAVSPGPQRTPVLFQAGTSSRGRAFAAAHAEAVFIQGQNAPQAAKQVASIRETARASGRAPESVKIISGMTVVLGTSHHEAQVRREELEDLYAPADAAVVFAGMTGIDLRRLERTAPVTEAVAAGLDSQQGQTLIDRYVKPGSPVPTIGEVLDRFRLQALRGFQLTGTADEVAQRIQDLVETTDIDGFMLEPTFGDSDVFAEFAQTVVPLLRQRELMPPIPAPESPVATLRERVTGSGPRRSSHHPSRESGQG